MKADLSNPTRLKRHGFGSFDISQWDFMTERATQVPTKTVSALVCALCVPEKKPRHSLLPKDFEAVQLRCKHICEAMKKSIDAEAMGMLMGNDNLSASENILVPLFLERPLSVIVNLEASTNNHLAVYARFFCVSDSYGLGSRFLGFISVGEGRWSIREMLIDHLHNAQCNLDPECRSHSHTYKHAALLKADVEKTNKAEELNLHFLHQVFPLMFLKKCYYCTRSPEDADACGDLVPNFPVAAPVKFPSLVKSPLPEAPPEFPPKPILSMPRKVLHSDSGPIGSNLEQAIKALLGKKP